MKSPVMCACAALFALGILSHEQLALSTGNLQSTREISAYAPYWYIDDRTNAYLEVKNNLGVQLDLIPILTSSLGDPIKLDVMSLAPYATKRINLKSARQLLLNAKGGEGHWGTGSRPGSRLGNAQLIPISPKGSTARDFSAWILEENPEERLGMVGSMFEVPAHAVTNILEGLWWLPYDGTRAYYVLQNTSPTTAIVRMELFVEGRLAKRSDVKLPPSAFHLIDVLDELKFDPSPVLGGARFTYGAETGETPSGQVLCRGILIQEKRGFSVSFMLHESLGPFAAKSVAELQAPAAYFGKLSKLSGRSKAYIHPHVLMRNTADHGITVRVDVYGRNSAGTYTHFSLKPLTLGPEAVMNLDLEEKRQELKSSLANGMAGIRLTHDGGPTDLMADLINVDRTGDFSLYDDVRNLYFHHANEQRAISFNLANRGQSFIVLKNVTEKTQQANLRLDYEEGKRHFDIKLDSVPPQQLQLVDIRNLRDSRVQDSHGQVLPADVEFGGTVISSEPGAFVGSDPSLFYAASTLPTDGIGSDDLGDTDRPFHNPSCMSVPPVPPPPPPPSAGANCDMQHLALGSQTAANARTGTCIGIGYPAGGNFSWSTASNNVTLSGNSGGSITYTAANPSSSQNDTIIRVEYSEGGRTATSSSAPITVHVPTSLRVAPVAGDSGSRQDYPCANYCAVRRYILYQVLDQFGQLMPVPGLAAEESFVAGSNTCSGSSTPQPMNAQTQPDGTFSGADRLVLCTQACLPAAADCTPRGNCSLSFTQTWTVAGNPVRTNGVTMTCTNITVTPQ